MVAVAKAGELVGGRPMHGWGDKQLAGLSGNASDLVKLIAWAYGHEFGRELLRRCYFRWLNTSKINETMVEQEMARLVAEVEGRE